MLLYLDASIMVAVVRNEPTRPLFRSLLGAGKNDLLVSSLGIAEASAAIAARGRASNHTTSMLAAKFEELDQSFITLADPVEIVGSDVTDATRFVRHPDIAVRAPDAIHIAAAHRLGATLLTLDRGMARAAAALGVPYLNPAEA